MAAPPPPSFQQFEFHTIGKEPSLLKRMSTGQPTIPYHYTPSPPPTPHPERDIPPVVLNRPTLFEALGQSSLVSPFPVRQGSSTSSSDDDMQLQYPEPEDPPFVPNYAALKDLHSRLDTMQNLISLPPPKLPKVVPPTLPQPALVAVANALQHSESAQRKTQDLSETMQARVAVAQQSVATAQAMVYSLTQALSAAQATLDVAQKSLEDAHKAADDAKTVALASQTAAEAVANTKHILDVPTPARSPTPEPANPHAGIIHDMKQVLDGVKLWVSESETGHGLAPPSRHPSPKPQLPPPASDALPKIKVEEEATRALVELSDVKAARPDPQAEALEREAILRKMQDAKREQVRLDKLHAHAEAAKSILKEREEKAELANKPISTSSSQPSSIRPSPTGYVNAQPVVAPPSSAVISKVQGKKKQTLPGVSKAGSKPETKQPVNRQSPLLSVSASSTSAATNLSWSGTSDGTNHPAPQTSYTSKPMLNSTSSQFAQLVKPQPPMKKPTSKNKKAVQQIPVQTGAGSSKNGPPVVSTQKQAPKSSAKAKPLPRQPTPPPRLSARTPEIYHEDVWNGREYRSPSPIYRRSYSPESASYSNSNAQYPNYFDYYPSYSPPPPSHAPVNPYKRPRDPEVHQQTQNRFKDDREERRSLEDRLGVSSQMHNQQSDIFSRIHATPTAPRVLRAGTRGGKGGRGGGRGRGQGERSLFDRMG
ncbi:Exonuclease domain-containing protein [Mycena indigotica]|uniref:Exonuclease domain-containing protein n=1 Tax=Mycena indigotica TaxID=2126181 RepID=A0A8H6SMW6_9AGAR|nr:Exonuclease domain-containing protein [Mycena indigotica]KAF7301747.1 Exonuclease domain-containing protein [Mycena indigotica]